jgi:tRNA (cytidine56-2'-O)-methyltransferase
LTSKSTRPSTKRKNHALKIPTLQVNHPVITILRHGHRPERDKRITTHVALVARAFGADKILVTTRDDHLAETITSVVQRFGGDFTIETGVDLRSILRHWNGSIVHLTMYGETLETGLPKIDRSKDLLILVGAEKVPRSFYEVADVNIAVGNQPHSEVAAVAIFLDRYTNGGWQTKDFHGRLAIQPNPRGKTVQDKGL